MKYLSLFTGIGGFELGLSGHECVGYSEIDKYAIQVYQKHFPNHINYGDITKIVPRELPDFELLVGGFPCQAFSIAGKRAGFNEKRGTLFFDIARIIATKKPRLLLLENVKGLLSHDEGRTFEIIICTLDELGYDCQWQVLNSKDFGVPQNRERIFIIGHLRGTPRPEVFPFGFAEDTSSKKRITSTTIDANYWKGIDNHVQRTSIVVKGMLSDEKWDRFNESSRRVYDPIGISPTIPTVAGGGHTPKIIGGLQAHQTVRKDGLSPTLTTAMGQGGGQTPIVWADNLQIRRLTPTECERLQGFPDGWTKELSDTQRYKTLGNAVTTNVIRALAEKLI